MKSQQEYFSFPLFPSSVLSLAPFLFLAFSLLSSDTLCGKLKPQTTTLRNSKWILSARPTPPSPPLLPAHALGSGPGLGSVTSGGGSVQPTERVAKISALVSADGSQREGERLMNCKSGLLASFSSGQSSSSLSFSSGWGAGEWHWLAYCQLSSTPLVCAPLCSMRSAQ